MKYVAMWNLPGCLPEMGRATFDTFDAAKRFIIAAIKDAEEVYGDGLDEDTAESLCHLAEDVNLESSPFEVLAADGLVYTVQVSRS